MPIQNIFPIDSNQHIKIPIGYRIWDESPDAPSVSLRDVQAGSAVARREMCGRILESTYQELSDGDLAFLAAMLPDEDVGPLKDIAGRLCLGKSGAYVSTYRRHLLRQGAIGDRGRGEVGFDLPTFKDFLAEKRADSRRASIPVEFVQGTMKPQVPQEIGIARRHG